LIVGGAEFSADRRDIEPHPIFIGQGDIPGLPDGGQALPVLAAFASSVVQGFSLHPILGLIRHYEHIPGVEIGRPLQRRSRIATVGGFPFGCLHALFQCAAFLHPAGLFLSQLAASVLSAVQLRSQHLRFPRLAGQLGADIGQLLVRAIELRCQAFLDAGFVFQAACEPITCRASCGQLRLRGVQHLLPARLFSCQMGVDCFLLGDRRLVLGDVALSTDQILLEMGDAPLVSLMRLSYPWSSSARCTAVASW